VCDLLLLKLLSNLWWWFKL